MMRLLKGRVFYLGIVLFVLGLVLWRHSNPSAPLIMTPEMPVLETAESTEIDFAGEGWWEKDIDTERLNEAVKQDPVLRLFLLILTFFGVSMCLGGVAIFLWSLATGKIRRVWQGPWHKPPRWTLGEFWRITVLIAMIGILFSFVRMALIGLWPNLVLDLNLWINISMLMLHVMLLLIAYAFAADKFRSAGKAFGLSAKPLSGAFGIGIRGYMAIFPWLLLVLFLVVETANRLHYIPPPQPIHEMIFMENRAPVLGLTILMTCLMGPLAEEVFFRGILFAALRQHLSRWPAMLLSGALFSMVHTNVIGFIPIMMLGCFLAYLYERTGSLSAPVAIHMLHNAFLLGMALTYRMAI